MTPIKRNLLYIFRGTLLRLRISWSGQQLTLSVGYHVDKADDRGRAKWDGSRCKANTSHGDDKVPAAIINRYLESLETKVENAFYKYELEDRLPTKDDIRNEISPKAAGRAKHDFFRAFDEFVRDQSVQCQWSDAYIHRMNSTKKLLMAFKADLTYEYLNMDGLNAFLSYQTTCTSSGRKKWMDHREKIGYLNRSIRNNISDLLRFLTWSKKRGYTRTLDFEDFNPRLKHVKNPVVFLEWDELMKVYDYDFSFDAALDHARNIFCFSCFTSLRYSDVCNLKWAHIYDDKIHITTQKTGKRIEIELNNYSRGILDKYRVEGVMPDAPVFPGCDRATIVKRIKRVGEECDIDSPIEVTYTSGAERYDVIKPKFEFMGTHTGRRTFISNAITMGISPNTVMKWTGHSDYKAMEPYIEIADKSKVSAMKKFNRKR